MNVNPTISKCGKKAWSIARKVRPGHIMFGAMLVMTCMTRCSNTPQTKDHTEMMKWSYEMGEQRVRDSIKIAELQNKLAADSMKIYHKIPKGVK